MRKISSSTHNKIIQYLVTLFPCVRSWLSWLERPLRGCVVRNVTGSSIVLPFHYYQEHSPHEFALSFFQPGLCTGQYPIETGKMTRRHFFYQTKWIEKKQNSTTHQHKNINFRIHLSSTNTTSTINNILVLLK